MLQIPKAAPHDILEHPDTAEIVYVSSLALLKMLQHGRAGVPMEVLLLFRIQKYSMQGVQF